MRSSGGTIIQISARIFLRKNKFIDAAINFSFKN